MDFQEVWKIDKVLVITLTDEETLKRLSGRRTCPTCGKVYNTESLPPKVEGKCDIEGADLTIRNDDKPEAIKKRLEIYHTQTKDVIEHYKEKGVVVEVNGLQSIDEVSEEIKSKLN